MKRKLFKKKKHYQPKQENYVKNGSPSATKHARPDDKMGDLTVAPFIDPVTQKALENGEEVSLAPATEIRKGLKKANNKKRRQHDNAISKEFREDFS